MNRILFAASECVPFIPNGSLAETCGSLPGEMDPEEWDVRVVLPGYSFIPEEYRRLFRPLCTFSVSAGEGIRDRSCQVSEGLFKGIRYYLLENADYLKGTAPYGEIRQDIEKFIFFDKAVLAMLPEIGFQPQIIHCHDWEMSLIPVFLHYEYRKEPFYSGIRTILTVHNLRYQGIWDIPTFRYLSGLPEEAFTIRTMEFKGQASMLKGGLIFADYITTTSDTYADEILTAEFGEGLEGVLSNRHMDLQGITGGIDDSSYDPATDPEVYCNYSLSDWYEKKRINKLSLQRELDLPENPDRFLIALISDLTAEKGMELITDKTNGISDEYTQFVVLGKGDPLFEGIFRSYAWKYSGRVSCLISKSDALARKLYAAADAILMSPSAEPCGLQPLIAFRYGAVPIVRYTGGLRDTVTTFRRDEGCGDGFTFSPYRSDEMLRTVNYAKQIYYDDPTAWSQMVERGMRHAFSWKEAARRYQDLYRFLIIK